MVAHRLLSCGMRTLSCGIHVGSNSLTRDRTWAPCVGSAESYPLCHQGSPQNPHFLKNLFIYFYFWLCWVFVSMRGLSLVAASGGHSSSRWAGLSLSRPLLLRSTGSRRAGSVVVAHGPSCSAACGIFPDQCLNPCSLHWQADSQPLRHQGSPLTFNYCILLCNVAVTSYI